VTKLRYIHSSKVTPLSQLYSYEVLRDQINNHLDTLHSGLEELDIDELKQLLTDLISERRIMIEEIDEMRESRYGWINHANTRIHSMKLLMSNLDDETYNNLQAKASRLGIEDGKLLNELMQQALAKPQSDGIPELSSKDLSHLNKDAGHITIQHIPELIVTRKDLEESSYRVKFSHINSLQFDTDIDKELFYQKVKKINRCGRISLPSNISKLIAYAKAGHCKEYEFK